MIGMLKGEIVQADGKKALLMTNIGVGYEVNYHYHANIGEEILIYVHHHITENDQSLWGFKTLEDKMVFELLKTVNKVGSSKAYPLISHVGREHVLQAISFDQPEILTQAPGIGKKMAEQIILSLKDKVTKEFSQMSMTSTISKTDKASATSNFDEAFYTEALSALQSLGYRDKDVLKVMKNIDLAQIKTTEDVIKSVLKEI